MSSAMLGGLPAGVLFIIVALLAFMAAIGGLLYQVSFGPRAKLNKRMQAVLGTGQRKGRASISGPAARKRQIKLKDRETKQKKSFRQRVEGEIAQAGLAWSFKYYLILSVLLAAGSAFAYWLSGMPSIGLPMVAITMGLGAPKFILRFRCKRRVNKFISLFPDALDVIVRGIRSGLPVGECITVIGREMPDPVGVEFRLLSESQRLGVGLDEALRRATERVPNQELRFFAIVLSIQQQTGGNLADTLSKLSDVLRMRKRMRDKVQAMSSEAKSSAGIIGSLPFAVSGLLALIAPEYIGLLFTTDTGHILIGIGLGVMSLGIFVMRQMINFDI